MIDLRGEEVPRLFQQIQEAAADRFEHLSKNDTSPATNGDSTASFSPRPTGFATRRARSDCPRRGAQFSPDVSDPNGPALSSLTKAPVPYLQTRAQKRILSRCWQFSQREGPVAVHITWPSTPDSIMQRLFTVQRLVTLALGVMAIGSWRLWRRPAEGSVSREVALLRRLSKSRRG